MRGVVLARVTRLVEQMCIRMNVV